FSQKDQDRSREADNAKLHGRQGGLPHPHLRRSSRRCLPDAPIAARDSILNRDSKAARTFSSVSATARGRRRRMSFSNIGSPSPTASRISASVVRSHKNSLMAANGRADVIAR